MIEKNPARHYWLFEEHFADLESYLYEWVKDEYSRGDLDDPFRSEKGTVLWEFHNDPTLGKYVLEDWITNKKDLRTNVKKLLNHIRTMEVQNINFRGARRSGKTTTAYALAEFLKNEYNIVVVAPYIDVEVLPDWIEWKPSIKELRKGDLAILDEAGIQYNARRSMSGGNVSDLEWLPVAAHTGARLFVITQLSSITDINIMKFCNIDICKGYKTMAYGESTTERQQILDKVTEYLEPSNDYIFKGSYVKSWSLVSMGEQKFTIYLEKPDCVTDAVSRPYMQFIEKANGNKEKSDEIAMGALKLMIDNEVNPLTIFSQLTTRGFNITLGQIHHLYEMYGQRENTEMDERLLRYFDKSTKRPKSTISGKTKKNLLPGLS